MPSDGPTPATTSDDLFDLPVGEFVKARDALVRRRKADGAKEEAATVKALRRPTMAAWAVNQVVRSNPEVGDRLVTTAADIQRAQRRALSGVRDDRLREASVARRRLVEELVDQAAEILAASGATPAAHLDDVGQTFEAATTDPDVAARVAQGRLSAPIHPSTDFTAVAGLATVAPTDSAATEQADAGAGDQADDADEEVARQRRAAIRALQVAQGRADASRARAETAREDAARLEDKAARAMRTVERARTRAAEAAAAAERAATAARDLAAQADAAVATAADAAAAADADASEVDRARAALDDLA